jgi:hypothetical protein
VAAGDQQKLLQHRAPLFHQCAEQALKVAHETHECGVGTSQALLVGGVPRLPLQGRKSRWLRGTYLVEIAAAAAEKVFELGWSLSQPRARPLGHQTMRGGEQQRGGRGACAGSASLLPRCLPSWL